MKAYIKIDATKELPEKKGNYLIEYTDGLNIYNDCLDFNLEDKTFEGIFDYEQFYWLKEISLTELMDDFGTWIICSNYSYDPSTALYFQMNPFKQKTRIELTTEFLTQKGIITKD